MLGPIFALGRLVNTAATAYVVGQIGWKAFKEIRSMQQEKMRSCEIRAKFVTEYIKKHGVHPDEELVQMALDAASAVDQPVRSRVDRFVRSASEKMQECVDFATDVVESASKHCTTPGDTDVADKECKDEVCQHRSGDFRSEPPNV